MNRLKQHHKTCEICQCKFWSHRSDARTCSETCKKRRQRGTQYAYVKGPLGPHTLKKLPPAPSLAQVPATRSGKPGRECRRDVPATRSATPGTKAEALSNLYPHGKDVFCDVKEGVKPGRVDWKWGTAHQETAPDFPMIPVNLGFEWRWLHPTKNGGWCCQRKQDARAMNTKPRKRRK